ncbi:MAG TPA: hypothetical protein VM577_14190 [Anaerovoracaceae bacterium]|nr:hypothetical protein [Anaerovoracaceae bacterium]
MSFIKNGDCEIINIIKTNDGEVTIDAKKTNKILKAAKEEAKNLDKDGNKSESSKESE